MKSSSCKHGIWRHGSALNPSLDVVMEYSFGYSDHRVEAPDFAPWFIESIVAAQKSTHLMKHMIWIFHVIQMLPDSFGLYFMPELMQLVKLQRVSSVGL